MVNMVLGFLNIGTSEMLLIVFVALLLFGGKKLPELARGLGRGIREFKDASETIKRDISQQINDFESDVAVKDLIQDENAESATHQNQGKRSDPADQNPHRSDSKDTDKKQATQKDQIPAAFQSGPPAGTYQHQPHRGAEESRTHDPGREPDYVEPDQTPKPETDSNQQSTQ